MRFNERSFVVLVSGVLVVAVVAALAWALLLREDDSAAGGGSAVNAASSFEGGPPEVLMMSGATLVRRNVEKQTEDLVTDIPSPSVYAAPGSPWLAYVASKKGGGNDDFAGAPVLHLLDVENDEKSAHGPGVAPVWNAAGTHVAFLRPVEPRDCAGESCSGDVQIGVVEASTGRESVLLDPGRYTVLGWSGDWILVSDFDSPTEVISVSLDDERTTLDMPSSQFWAASPDGEWVIKTNAKKTEFISVTDGELGEERIPVEVGEYELLEGSWSHDSSTVAAVTRITSGTYRGDKKKPTFVEGEPTTQVMAFSPESPELEPVADTYGATGNLLWAPDNESVVFSSLLDPKRALFQAKHCPLGNSGACSIVTSWTEGVVLLRAE
ncbi:MAG TPA: hypothetical protein VG318_07115 [Actinomycetota bacterium]|nr:hypothetical protein [Actinomycetota bacterium]